MTPRVKLTIRIVTVVYTALLMAGSLLPSGSGPLGGWDAAITPDLQDTLHLPAYAGLMVLVSLAWSTRFRTTATSLVVIAGACVAFGVAMELAQSVIPGRTCGLGDALTNVVGAALGLVSAFAWRLLHTRRGSTKAAPPPACESVECRIQ